MPRLFFSAFLSVSLFFFGLSFGARYEAEIHAIPEDTNQVSSWIYAPQNVDSPKWWAKDLSKWKPLVNSQVCPGTLAPESNAQQLVYDFHFLGPGTIEYFAFGTDVPKIEGEILIGMKVQIHEKDGKPLNLPFNLRFLDPSGECHQIPLNIRCNGWRIGKIQSSGGCWGGDGDHTLQFPCRFESVTMDRKFDGYKVEGRLVVEDIRFFTRRELETMMNVELADESLRAGKNIFPAAASSDGSSPKIRFRVTPDARFADRPVFVQVDRRTNGNFSQEAEPNQTVFPISKGEIELERNALPGFESFIFTPFWEENGQKHFGQPLKYSFVVPYADPSPKYGSADFRNRWFCVSTHANIGCVDRLATAGFGMIRDDCIWRGIEREKGVYTFPKYLDDYVDHVLSLGLEPLLIILYSNALYDGDDFPHTEEGLAAYSRYAAEVVKHFKGRVRYFEVWNEWNGGCTMPQARHTKSNSPENYVRLLASASKAMRAANPDIFIIGGGGDHPTWHRKQIEREMELGVMKYCDAYSVHPYVQPNTPEGAKMPDRLREIIDLMRQNGCETPRLWLTELGWPTDRGLTFPGGKDSDSGTREEYSARMFVQSALEYRSIPEIERYFWYDLQNDGTDLNYNEHNFGILHNHTTGWQPKPVLAAMGTLARLLGDAEVTACRELWTENLRVWKIARPDRTIYCAWTTEGEETIRLPNEPTRVLGLYGNELPPETRTVTPQPVYFVE
ncbi:MAG: hypothetical protein Q4A17_11300 [Thermoguttaceae bacterium]|nr:hypothetical protein [Thermoguttaceae bacterium]